MHLKMKFKKWNAICSKRSVVFGVIIFFAFITFFISTTQIVMEYQTHETGTVNLYYTEEINEEETVVKKRILQTDGGTGKVYFDIPFWSINDLKFSFEGIEMIGLKQLKVKTFGFFLADVLGRIRTEDFIANKCEVLSENNVLVKVDDTQNELLGEKLGLVFGGLLKIIVVSFMLSIVVGVASKIFNNLVKSRWDTDNNVAFIMCIICVILFVLFIVERIDQKVVEESTIIYEDRTKTDKALEHYELIFSAEKENACSILVENVKASTNAGSAKYIVSENESGRILLDKNVKLEEILKNGIITIDATDMEFVRGKEYTIDLYIAKWEQIVLPQYKKGQVYTTVIYKFHHRNVAYVFVAGIFIIYISILVLGKILGKERKYFATSVIVGIILVFLIPPFSGADEIRHFLRAYTLSQGNQNIETEVEEYIGSGDKKPTTAAAIPMQLSDLRLIEDGDDYDNISYSAERSEKVNWSKLKNVLTGNYSDEKDYISMWGVMTINPLCYLPQILLVFLWSLFKLPVTGLIYAARMGNLLFCLFVSWLTWKLAPRQYKNIVIATCFIPDFMVVQSTSSLDGMVVVLVRLFIVYVLYLSERKINIKWRQLFFMTGVLFYIALLKIPYVLVGTAVFMLQKENFVSIKARIRKIYGQKEILISCIMILVCVILLGISKITGVLMRGGSSLLSGEHVSFIFQYPLVFFTYIWKFLVVETVPYMLKGISINDNYLLAFCTCIGLFCGYVSTKKEGHSKKSQCIIWGIVALLCLSIFAVGYSLMKPGTANLTEISGRYFLPIVTVATLSNIPVKEKLSKFFALRWEMTMIISAVSVLYVFYLFWI